MQLSSNYREQGINLTIRILYTLLHSLTSVCISLPKLCENHETCVVLLRGHRLIGYHLEFLAKSREDISCVCLCV